MKARLGVRQLTPAGYPAPGQPFGEDRDEDLPCPSRGPVRARGRSCVRHRDRRARQGGRRAPLPRRGHRGSRGKVPFEKVWGLLVDGSFEPGMPPAEPHPLAVRTGDPRVDVQAALAMLAPEWGLRPADRHRRRAGARQPRARRRSWRSRSSRSRRAGSAGRRCRRREIDKAESIPERFLIRWRGEANPDHVKAIDAYWISAAEHGMNASTFTARVIASTGADVAAALSRRGRRAVRPAARRRALARAADARRRRARRATPRST